MARAPHAFGEPPGARPDQSFNQSSPASRDGRGVPAARRARWRARRATTTARRISTHSRDLRRPQPPPWSIPRQRAAPRRCARRSLRQHPACTSLPPSLRPSRFSAIPVTCDWPTQGGWDSGRYVTMSNTGSAAIFSTVRSSSSREGGSIQCRSSKIINTGCRRVNAWSCRSNAANVRSFLRCGRGRAAGRARRRKATAFRRPTRCRPVPPRRRVAPPACLVSWSRCRRG